MTDRYFANLMPSLLSDEEELSSSSSENRDSLSRLLSTPYPSLSEHFKRAALDLKETILIETWGVTEQRVTDPTLYAGTLGTAFLLFKAYLVTHNVNDLTLCSQIVKACHSSSLGSRWLIGFRDVTFICGRGGICALGAVAAKYAGDEPSLRYYLSKFKEIKLPTNLPDELLYGRVGYLWACLFINKHLGDETIPSSVTRLVVSKVIKSGRALGSKEKFPLTFEWYGKKYLGAAHGIAGIIHVLMDMDLKPDEVEDVKATLRYLIRNQHPSGNYPTSEEEDKTRDVLVHWCHGAPGIALTLAKAAKVFEDKEFTEAAIEASKVVWNRGLLKRVGVCHGISGNAYVFLSLYRLTGDVQFLYKAKAFACFLLDRAHKLIARGDMHGGDSHYSLFEGVGGMAHLFLDMVEPTESRFPAYEL